jgi:hypothetical protein
VLTAASNQKNHGQACDDEQAIGWIGKPVIDQLDAPQREGQSFWITRRAGKPDTIRMVRTYCCDSSQKMKPLKDRKKHTTYLLWSMNIIQK